MNRTSDSKRVVVTGELAQTTELPHSNAGEMRGCGKLFPALSMTLDNVLASALEVCQRCALGVSCRIPTFVNPSLGQLWIGWRLNLLWSVEAQLCYMIYYELGEED